MTVGSWTATNNGVRCRPGAGFAGAGGFDGGRFHPGLLGQGVQDLVDVA